MFFIAQKCPNCKIKGSKVQKDTMMHHVKDISRISNVNYLYCSTPECDTIYYGDGEIFTEQMINKEVGLKKNSSPQSAICFCYNYLKTELYEPSVIKKINIRIDNYGSRCDLRSPSGECCLKYIKKIQKENSSS